VGQRALFGCAILLLGYCGFALVDAWIFQRRESRDLDRLVRARAGERRRASGSPGKRARHRGGRSDRPPRDSPSARFRGGRRRGRQTTLRRAVGHIPGTLCRGTRQCGPGRSSDTFFRPLKDLRIKDQIRFSTLSGELNYEVESLKVWRRRMLGTRVVGANVLTLVTCYPFTSSGRRPSGGLLEQDRWYDNAGFTETEWR